MVVQTDNYDDAFVITSFKTLESRLQNATARHFACKLQRGDLKLLKPSAGAQTNPMKIKIIKDFFHLDKVKVLSALMIWLYFALKYSWRTRVRNNAIFEIDINPELGKLYCSHTSSRPSSPKT